MFFVRKGQTASGRINLLSMLECPYEPFFKGLPLFGRQVTLSGPHFHLCNIRSKLLALSPARGVLLQSMAAPLFFLSALFLRTPLALPFLPLFRSPLLLKSLCVDALKKGAGQVFKSPLPIYSPQRPIDPHIGQ